MRCKNCGWPNKPGAMTCVKCQSPLESEPTHCDQPAYRQSGYQQPANNGGGTIPLTDDMRRPVPPPDAPPQKPTELEPGRAQSTPMTTPPRQTSGITKCPKCGYPLRQGVTKCPHCQYSIKTPTNPVKIEETTIEKPEDRQPINMPKKNILEMLNKSKPVSPAVPRQKSDTQEKTPTQEVEKPRHGGTINFWADMQSFTPVSQCKLIPVKRQGERMEFSPKEFEGDTVKLNRDNTEPANMSITSKTQAELVCEDGKWSIVDRSDLHTTFVLATRKTPLQDGDIILLGNRLFEFHE